MNAVKRNRGHWVCHAVKNFTRPQTYTMFANKLPMTWQAIVQLFIQNGTKRYCHLSFLVQICPTSISHRGEKHLVIVGMGHRSSWFTWGHFVHYKGSLRSHSHRDYLTYSTNHDSSKLCSNLSLKSSGYFSTLPFLSELAPIFLLLEKVRRWQELNPGPQRFKSSQLTTWQPAQSEFVKV